MSAQGWSASDNPGAPIKISLRLSFPALRLCLDNLAPQGLVVGS